MKTLLRRKILPALLALAMIVPAALAGGPSLVYAQGTGNTPPAASVGAPRVSSTAPGTKKTEKPNSAPNRIANGGRAVDAPAPAPIATGTSLLLGASANPGQSGNELWFPQGALVCYDSYWPSLGGYIAATGTSLNVYVDPDNSFTLYKAADTDTSAIYASESGYSVHFTDSPIVSNDSSDFVYEDSGSGLTVDLTGSNLYGKAEFALLDGAGNVIAASDHQNILYYDNFSLAEEVCVHFTGMSLDTDAAYLGVRKIGDEDYYKQPLNSNDNDIVGYEVLDLDTAEIRLYVQGADPSTAELDYTDMFGDPQTAACSPASTGTPGVFDCAFGVNLQASIDDPAAASYATVSIDGGTPSVIDLSRYNYRLYVDSVDPYNYDQGESAFSVGLYITNNRSLNLNITDLNDLQLLVYDENKQPVGSSTDFSANSDNDWVYFDVSLTAPLTRQYYYYVLKVNGEILWSTQYQQYPDDGTGTDQQANLSGPYIDPSSDDFFDTYLWDDCYFLPKGCTNFDVSAQLDYDTATSAVFILTGKFTGTIVATAPAAPDTWEDSDGYSHVGFDAALPTGILPDGYYTLTVNVTGGAAPYSSSINCKVTSEPVYLSENLFYYTGEINYPFVTGSGGVEPIEALNMDPSKTTATLSDLLGNPPVKTGAGEDFGEYTTGVSAIGVTLWDSSVPPEAWYSIGVKYDGASVSPLDGNVNRIIYYTNKPYVTGAYTLANTNECYITGVNLDGGGYNVTLSPDNAMMAEPVVLNGLTASDGAIDIPAAALDGMPAGPYFAAVFTSGGDLIGGWWIYVGEYSFTVGPLSSACDVTAVTAPSGATINGTSIAANVDNSVTNQTVAVTVSPNATWKLFSDAGCTQEITNKTMTLSVGANAAYIQVTAQDGSVKVYTVTVTWASGGNNNPGGGNPPAQITYAVTFNTNGGGAVTSQSVASGNKAAQPADPVKDGYTFAGWYADAALTAVYDFTQPVTGNLTLYAAWTENTVTPPAEWQNPFSDVNPDDWFYGDVQYVNENGLMLGTAADLFSPNENLSRGMLVTILYRAAGSPDVSGLANPFSDVADGQYYADAAIWAATNGIVSGIGNGLYDPNANITRQDLAVILYRYAQYAGLQLPVTKDYTGFTDDADVSGYAKDAVEAFFQAGIISGYPDGSFKPDGTATRAEVATMITKFFELINGE